MLLYKYTVNYQGWLSWVFHHQQQTTQNRRSLSPAFAGYAIINVARKPEVGDTVLVSFCGSLDFAKVQGKALITQDGEAIEGDALDDATVMGVVTHLLNRVTDTDNRPVI